MTGSSEDPKKADPALVEEDPQGVPPADRAANGALLGCLWLVGGGLVFAFFYFGFYAFAVADFMYGWGVLEPYLDERTNDILYVVYWPLIQIVQWLGLP